MKVKVAWNLVLVVIATVASVHAAAVLQARVILQGAEEVLNGAAAMEHSIDDIRSAAGEASRTLLTPASEHFDNRAPTATSPDQQLRPQSSDAITVLPRNAVERERKVGRRKDVPRSEWANTPRGRLTVQRNAWQSRLAYMKQTEYPQAETEKLELEIEDLTRARDAAPTASLRDLEGAFKTPHEGAQRKVHGKPRVDLPFKEWGSLSLANLNAYIKAVVMRINRSLKKNINADVSDDRRLLQELKDYRTSRSKPTLERRKKQVAAVHVATQGTNVVTSESVATHGGAATTHTSHQPDSVTSPSTPSVAPNFGNHAASTSPAFPNDDRLQLHSAREDRSLPAESQSVNHQQHPEPRPADGSSGPASPERLFREQLAADHAFWELVNS